MPSSVSVVVPAYNYAQYLPAALDSALGQDHPGELLEVIVVDDGSTDETPDVLSRYADRVRVIRQPNGGLNAAISTGLEAATGELITFLDADDTWPRDRVRRLARALATHPEALLAYGDMAIVDDDGTVLQNTFAFTHQRRSGRLLGPLLPQNFVSAGAMMVRAEHRDIYHPVPDFAPYQDWWIACRLAAAGPFVYVNAVVNHYRQHAANMNLGVDFERVLALKRSTLRFRRWLLDTTEVGAVALADLAQALAVFDEHVGVFEVHDPACLDELVPPDRNGALEALHAASEAVDRDELEDAAVWLVRSAVRDQHFAEPRDLLVQLLPVIAAGKPKVAARA